LKDRQGRPAIPIDPRRLADIRSIFENQLKRGPSKARVSPASRPIGRFCPAAPPPSRCPGKKLPAFGKIFPPDTKSPDSTTSTTSVVPLAARELLKRLILPRQGDSSKRPPLGGLSLTAALTLSFSKHKSLEAASEYLQRASPNEDSAFGFSCPILPSNRRREPAR
jgi:hypothetical protein